MREFDSSESFTPRESEVKVCVLAADSHRNQLISSLLRSAGDSLGASDHTKYWEREQLERVRAGKDLDEDGGMDRHYDFVWVPPSRSRASVRVTLSTGAAAMLSSHLADAASVLILADDLPASRTLETDLRTSRARRVVVLGRGLPRGISRELGQTTADVRSATADELMLPQVWQFLCGEGVPLAQWRHDGSVSQVGVSGPPVRRGRKYLVAAALVLTALAALAANGGFRKTTPDETGIMLEVGTVRLFPAEVRRGELMEFEVALTVTSSSLFLGVHESIQIDGAHTALELVPFDLPGTTIRAGGTVRRGRVIVPEELGDSSYRFTYAVRVVKPGESGGPQWRSSPAQLTLLPGRVSAR